RGGLQEGIGRWPEEQHAESGERAEERVRVGDAAVRRERYRCESEESGDTAGPLVVKARREEIDERDRRRAGDRRDKRHRTVRILGDEVDPPKQEHVPEVARRMWALVHGLEALHATRVEVRFGFDANGSWVRM